MMIAQSPPCPKCKSEAVGCIELVRIIPSNNPDYSLNENFQADECKCLICGYEWKVE